MIITLQFKFRCGLTGYRGALALRGGGGFQMMQMTIDDEGEGGVWPMMTSSQKS